MGLSIIMVLVVLVTGCTASDEGEQPIELRLYMPGANPDAPMWADYSQYFKDVGAKYTELHPNRTIAIESFPATFPIENMARKLKAENSPDIVFPVNSALIPSWLKDSILLDLNPLAKADGVDKSDFHQPILKLTESGGKWGAIPNVVLPLGVLYNKSLFDKANLPYPQGKWTWDEYLSVALKLSEANPGKYGAVMAYNPFYLEILLAGRGESLLSKDGAKAEGALNSPGSVQTLQWFNRYFRALKLDQISGVSNDIATGSLFNLGSVGMKISTSDGYTFFKKQLGDRLGVAPLPGTADGRRANPLSVVGIGISAQSKHAREAWDFLRFATMTEHAYTSKWAEWFVLPSKSMAAATKQTQHSDLNVFIEEMNYAVESPAFANLDFALLMNESPFLSGFSSLLLKEDGELPVALYQLAQKTDGLLMEKAASREASSSK